MESKSEIIEKIQKLLALSKSSNQHEAELAAKRASDLMAKYQVDMATVEARNIKSGKERVGDVYFQVPDLRMKYQWVVILGLAAAKLYDGTILVDKALHGTSFRFIGFESEIPLMKSTFMHLYESWRSIVERDLEVAKNEAKRRSESWSVPFVWDPKRTMKYKLGHGQGYSEALYIRCSQIADDRNNALKSAGNDCTALVIVRNDGVQNWLMDRGIKSKPLKQQDGDHAAKRDGFRVGNSIALGGALN